MENGADSFKIANLMLGNGINSVAILDGFTKLFYNRALNAKSKEPYAELCLRLQGIPQFVKGKNVSK